MEQILLRFCLAVSSIQDVQVVWRWRQSSISMNLLAKSRSSMTKDFTTTWNVRLERAQSLLFDNLVILPRLQGSRQRRCFVELLCYSENWPKFVAESRKMNTGSRDSGKIAEKARYVMDAVIKGSYRTPKTPIATGLQGGPRYLRPVGILFISSLEQMSMLMKKSPTIESYGNSPDSANCLTPCALGRDCSK